VDAHRGRGAVAGVYPVAALVLAREAKLKSESPAEHPAHRTANTSESDLPRVGAFSLFALPVPSTHQPLTDSNDRKAAQLADLCLVTT
jgi:hypothetical protein